MYLLVISALSAGLLACFVPLFMACVDYFHAFDTRARFVLALLVFWALCCGLFYLVLRFSAAFSAAAAFHGVAL